MAPVHGVYVFHLNIMKNGKQDFAVVGIMKNTSLVQQAYVAYAGNQYSTHRSSSASAVVQMKKGDSVYCKLTRGQLNGDLGYPHFVGYLLFNLN